VFAVDVVNLMMIVIARKNKISELLIIKNKYLLFGIL
jgi:hypothetical protein